MIMADNRMFLVHFPTGLAAPLGNRYGSTWGMSETTKSNMGNLVETLFKTVGDSIYYGGCDDFVVALENTNSRTVNGIEYQYVESLSNGLFQFMIKA